MTDSSSLQMMLSIIYIVSPVDIIPEGNLLSRLLRLCLVFSILVMVAALAGILGIVGLLDDLLIVLIFLFHVAAIYRSVLQFRFGGSSQT